MVLQDIFYNDVTLKSDKWLPYFKVYEQYLSKFRNKSPVVVEVGVQGGGSLQMWRKYFGEDASIHGIDIDESVLEHSKYYDDNIKLYIGDQSSSSFWDTFLVGVPKIDVFVDDGGHSMNQQINTFIKVFSHINEGGVYICEDTHTSYYRGCDGGLRNDGTFLQLAKDLTDVVNYMHVDPNDPSPKYSILQDVCENMYSVSFFNSMVVITKEKLEPFVRDVVNEK
ncbi:class I SAM-dependent methyltransferase [Candidatus Dojkabacteria bacterium]|jgi:hypothetical protein|nr:class I SAM-dependent methyltransferase [Candidatus Dojkabacteria bacterium]